MAGGPQRSRPRARPRYNDQPPWYATGTRRRPPRAALSSRASSAGAAQRQRGPDGRFVPIETKECSICAETLALAEFAVSQISEQCNHPPGACLECNRSSIRFDLETKQWDQIRCLECRALMDYHHVKKYADEETFNRYEKISLRAAVGNTDEFVWCRAGCGSGQEHAAGSNQPIVTCIKCSHRFCFTHYVKWHEGLTCMDYDDFQASPHNFKSRAQRENDRLAKAERKARRRREAQEEADRSFAQGLLDEEAAEEAVMIAEREKRAREEREAAERAERAVEREHRRRQLERMRREVEQRQEQEQESLATVRRTTRPCPNCSWPIEKSTGCDHMACSQCRYEFCYRCGADYNRVRLYGNEYHELECPYHSRNIR